mmetsp:Transcript_4765/g.13568  ORF Transcript_4765/g.13568 Transcript_4765/m.13568 type:complete len:779 (+) Transcript_4765:121-2457(+)
MYAMPAAMPRANVVQHLYQDLNLGSLLLQEVDADPAPGDRDHPREDVPAKSRARGARRRQVPQALPHRAAANMRSEAALHRGPPQRRGFAASSSMGSLGKAHVRQTRRRGHMPHHPRRPSFSESNEAAKTSADMVMDVFKFTQPDLRDAEDASGTMAPVRKSRPKPQKRTRRRAIPKKQQSSTSTLAQRRRMEAYRGSRNTRNTSKPAPVDGSRRGIFLTGVELEDAAPEDGEAMDTRRQAVHAVRRARQGAQAAARSARLGRREARARGKKAWSLRESSEEGSFTSLDSGSVTSLGTAKTKRRRRKVKKSTRRRASSISRLTNAARDAPSAHTSKKRGSVREAWGYSKQGLGARTKANDARTRRLARNAEPASRRRRPSVDRQRVTQTRKPSLDAVPEKRVVRGKPRGRSVPRKARLGRAGQRQGAEEKSRSPQRRTQKLRRSMAGSGSATQGAARVTGRRPRSLDRKSDATRGVDSIMSRSAGAKYGRRGPQQRQRARDMAANRRSSFQAASQPRARRHASKSRSSAQSDRSVKPPSSLERDATKPAAMDKRMKAARQRSTKDDEANSCYKNWHVMLKEVKEARKLAEARALDAVVNGYPLPEEDLDEPSNVSAPEAEAEAAILTQGAARAPAVSDVQQTTDAKGAPGHDGTVAEGDGASAVLAAKPEVDGDDKENSGAESSAHPSGGATGVLPGASDRASASGRGVLGEAPYRGAKALQQGTAKGKVPANFHEDTKLYLEAESAFDTLQAMFSKRQEQMSKLLPSNASNLPPGVL